MRIVGILFPITLISLLLLLHIMSTSTSYVEGYEYSMVSDKADCCRLNNANVKSISTSFPSECMAACDTEPECAYISWSWTWSNCAICSACQLNWGLVETFPGSGIQRNARMYFSWEKVDDDSLLPDREFDGLEPFLREGEVHCADEGSICECNGLVRYGYLPRGGMAGPRAIWGRVECKGFLFGGKGDPFPGYTKACYCQETGIPRYEDDDGSKFINPTPLFNVIDLANNSLCQKFGQDSSTCENPDGTYDPPETDPDRIGYNCTPVVVHGETGDYLGAGIELPACRGHFNCFGHFVKAYMDGHLGGRKFKTPKTGAVICEERRCDKYLFLEGVEGDPDGKFGPCKDGIHLATATQSSCDLRCEAGYIPSGLARASCGWEGGKALSNFRCLGNCLVADNHMYVTAVVQGEAYERDDLDGIHHTPHGPVTRCVESSASDCQARCNFENGCAFFSYWPDGGCHLQTAGAVRVPNPVGWSGPVVNGPKSCDEQPPTAAMLCASDGNVLCPATALNNNGTCVASCIDNCTGYSFDPKGVTAFDEWGRPDNNTCLISEPIIQKMYIAQYHIFDPENPLLKLVGNRDTMVKVQIDWPAGLVAPSVTANITVEKKSLILKLDGPIEPPGRFESDPGRVNHRLEDSFTVVIKKEWILPGLIVTIFTGNQTESHEINVGAPTEIIMHMYDALYFDQGHGTNDYPFGWIEEWAEKVPISKLTVRRLPPVIWRKIVVGDVVTTGEEHFTNKTGKGFDGENGAAFALVTALHKANGKLDRGMTYINIQGVSTGGLGGNLQGAGVAGGYGTLTHELGHALSLPHWGGDPKFPWYGDMFGMFAPKTHSKGTHIGPTWNVEGLMKLGTTVKLVPPHTKKECGWPLKRTFINSYMEGGGSHQTSDYGFHQMQNWLEAKITIPKRDADGAIEWYRWNNNDGAYTSQEVLQNNGVFLPVEIEVEVLTLAVAYSDPSTLDRKLNVVYDPVGPYIGDLTRLFDAADENDMKDAGKLICPNKCDFSLRVTQGGHVRTYILETTSGFVVSTVAINIPSIDGEVTLVQLLHTPNVNNNGVGDDLDVLEYWSPVNPEKTGNYYHPNCRDEVNWSNGFGLGCYAYANLGHCANGSVVPLHEWTTNEKYRNPHQNCCVCGRQLSVCKNVMCGGNDRGACIDGECKCYARPTWNGFHTAGATESCDILGGDQCAINVASERGVEVTSPDGYNTDWEGRPAYSVVDGDDKTYWDQEDSVEGPHILQLVGVDAFEGYIIIGLSNNVYSPKSWELECDGAVIHSVENHSYTNNKFRICLGMTYRCSVVRLIIANWYGLSPAIREFTLIGTVVVVANSMTPSLSPFLYPSSFLSLSPSSIRSPLPSKENSSLLSETPSLLSTNPTTWPTASPSISPTTSPTTWPTASPSISPMTSPTTWPTATPSISPTTSPTTWPTSSPSISPTASPANWPTSIPSTLSLTMTPSTFPLANPSTLSITTRPSTLPSTNPSTLSPTSSPTAWPSSNPSTPTNLPSFFPCNNANENHFLIELMTDHKSKRGTSIFIHKKAVWGWEKSIKKLNRFPNDKLYTKSMCLKRNECYRFMIKDRDNDGICCESGSGWYNVYWDGVKLDHTPFDEGNGSKQKIEFGSCQTTEVPTKSPISLPPKNPCKNSNEKNLLIQFKTDEFSKWQNKILIHKKSTLGWKFIKKVKPSSNNKLMTYNICLTKRGCHRFNIIDKKSNGICCDNGNGWYSVHWGDEKLDHDPFIDGNKQTITFGKCG